MRLCWTNPPPFALFLAIFLPSPQDLGEIMLPDWDTPLSPWET